MKSLQTIQKVVGGLHILSKVAMILSFVWAGFAAVGLLCGMVWYQGGVVVGFDQNMMFSMTDTSSLTEMIGVFLVDMILAITDGILLAFALHYFKSEQADGTPFTKKGADQLMRLGILTIIIPIVAAALSASVCKLFVLSSDIVRDWGNIDCLTMGIILIFVSFVFQYGAELEQRK